MSTVGRYPGADDRQTHPFRPRPHYFATHFSGRSASCWKPSRWHSSWYGPRGTPRHWRSEQKRGTGCISVR